MKRLSPLTTTHHLTPDLPYNYHVPPLATAQPPSHSPPAGELLSAVSSLAGPASGVRVLDKAQVVVNTIKVVQTLDAIVEVLKVGWQWL